MTHFNPLIFFILLTNVFVFEYMTILYALLVLFVAMLVTTIITFLYNISIKLFTSHLCYPWCLLIESKTSIIQLMTFKLSVSLTRGQGQGVSNCSQLWSHPLNEQCRDLNVCSYLHDKCILLESWCYRIFILNMLNETDIISTLSK